MSSSKSFSILGKNIKANSAADLEPYLTELKNLDDVEEVHFGANSLGVEACQAIAEVLKTKKSLKVCFSVFLCRVCAHDRLSTWQMCLLDDLFPKSPKRFLPFVTLSNTTLPSSNLIYRTMPLVVDVQMPWSLSYPTIQTSKSSN